MFNLVEMEKALPGRSKQLPGVPKSRQKQLPRTSTRKANTDTINMDAVWQPPCNWIGEFKACKRLLDDFYYWDNEDRIKQMCSVFDRNGVLEAFYHWYIIESFKENDKRHFLTLSKGFDKTNRAMYNE